MATVYLGLGTNLGERLANLQAAVAGMAPLVTVTALSPVFETPPWGVTAQPPFLNMCLAGETGLTPLSLLAGLKSLERSLGRQPGQRWGPRLIDIDILAYDDLVMAGAGLTIPHAGLAERAFVLAPLATIAPGWRHPVTGRSVRAMLAAVDASGVREVGPLEIPS